MCEGNITAHFCQHLKQSVEISKEVTQGKWWSNLSQHHCEDIVIGGDVVSVGT